MVFLGMWVLLLSRCWEDAETEEKGLVEPRKARDVLDQQGSDLNTKMK